jgi:hypothetical protein
MEPYLMNCRRECLEKETCLFMIKNKFNHPARQKQARICRPGRGFLEDLIDTEGHPR